MGGAPTRPCLYVKPAGTPRVGACCRVLLSLRSAKTFLVLNSTQNCEASSAINIYISARSRGQYSQGANGSPAGGVRAMNVSQLAALVHHREIGKLVSLCTGGESLRSSMHLTIVGDASPVDGIRCACEERDRDQRASKRRSLVIKAAGIITCATRQAGGGSARARRPVALCCNARHRRRAARRYIVENKHTHAK